MALIAEWKRAHDNGSSPSAPPMPGDLDAFLRLVEAGWDAEAARRPHGAHTTVVVHVDVEERAAALHLGPLLSDADRRYLSCDATCEVWFERDGRPIGAGRATRTVNRRLRRALEHRHPTARFPAVGPPADCTPTTSGTGKTAAPPNCPTWSWSARITTGPTTAASSPSPDPRTISSSATATVDQLTTGSIARAPTRPPPDVPPCPGPTGERADWWWYEPFQPQPPPTDN